MLRPMRVSNGNPQTQRENLALRTMQRGPLREAPGFKELQEMCAQARVICRIAGIELTADAAPMPGGPQDLQDHFALSEDPDNRPYLWEMDECQAY